MHDSILTPELKEFREAVRKWVAKEIAPYHEEWEKVGITPKELYKKAGEQGFLCSGLPEQYGGMGLDFRYSSIVNEECARAMASGIAFYLHSDIVVPYIEHFGSEEQKQKYLPGCVTGEYITAIGMTEPGTGSDLQGIQTKATLDGDDWVLNGAKTFISNGIQSNLLVVVAKTGEADENSKYQRLSLFLVEEGTAGFERGRNLEKMGLKAQDTAELHFNNCRIPKENLLGEEGKGFIYMTSLLAQERLCVALWCNAYARTALELTVKYVKERKAFKRRIADFQNTRYKLAELQTQVDVSEAFTDRAVMKHITGEDTTVEASQAKYWASEMMGKVTDECVQLFGGYGYMLEYPISKAYLDARVQRIYAGTTEIMKEIISRDVLK